MSNITDLQQFIVLPQQICENVIEIENENMVNIQENEYKYWTVDHTKMLIDLYGVHRKKLGSFEIKSLKKLWEVIAKKLRETFAINVTASNVENRWRVLERNYKKYVDNNKQTGRGRKIFAYAEQMEQILGKKKSIRPEVLLSTSTIEELPSNDQIREEILSLNVDTLTKPMKHNKENIIVANNCPEANSRNRIPKIKRNKVLDSRNNILIGMRKDKNEYQEKRLKIEGEKLDVQREKVKEMRRRNDLLAERNQLLKTLIESEKDSVETVF